MATILAMVNAEKEGQIESKMMKARQLEEIRDAKRREAEARQAKKKSKLVSLSFFLRLLRSDANSEQDEAKDSIRNKRRHKGDNSQNAKVDSTPASDSSKPKTKRKSVSFA